MVTGVETAGLVLGSLPLLISALEHYEDIVRPAREFFTWRKHRRKLVQELYTLRASYDQAIEILLKPIAEPEDLTTMMEDPRNDLWETGPIADSLRNTLGSAYDPLILGILEIAEILSSIAAHLNIEGSNQGTTQLRDLVIANRPVANTRHPKRNFEFKKRVAFTMRKSGIKASLERLEGCTKRIDTWVERAEKIQNEPATHRSKVRFTDSLGAIQGNASRIYDALSKSWCKIKPHHPSFLLLEQRLKRPQQKRRGLQCSIFNLTTESTCFKLSINGECCPSSQQLNTELRVAELPSSSSRVRITVAAAQGAQERPYAEPSKLPQVKDFCRYIQKPGHDSIGFCLDDAGSLRAYSSAIPAIQYTKQCATLESLLPNLQAKLPLEELYCLAITLVSSLFQLSHTPWLDREWTKKNIAFLRVSDIPPLAVDIKYPYLLRNFVQSNSEPSNQSSKATTTDCSNILALAILLLEVNFGTPIEQVRRPEDLGNTPLQDEKADLQTADRWYKAERPRLSSGFSKAILAGLQEYLNPDANLDDPEYCNVLKEKMLQPLEDEMQFLVFGPPR